MAHSDDEGFLSRWARRKAQREKDEERRDAASAADQAETVPESAAETLSQAGEGESAPGEKVLSGEDLPDPETLGRDDDWTPYLKRNVPSELRIKALRRLWRLDPVYANLDGLVDYAEDYNGPAFTGKPVKTLFQVGRGMVLPDEPKTPKEEATAPGEIPTSSAESQEAGTQLAAETNGDSERGEAEPERLDAAASKVPASVEPFPKEEQEVQSGAPRARRALARRWGAVDLHNQKEH